MVRRKDSWQWELAARLVPGGLHRLARRGLREGLLRPETFAARRSDVSRSSGAGRSAAFEYSTAGNRGRYRSRATEDPGPTVLHLALELDRRIYRGAASGAALSELRLLRRFDDRMLDALGGYAPTQVEFELRQIPIRMLRAGMVIEKDVSTTDGNLLILKKGTVLNDLWIERLENFARVRGAQEFVSVRVPRAAEQTGRSAPKEGALS